MIRSIKLVFLVGFFIISYSCKKDLLKEPQYERPAWLAGKVYTQIEAQKELSIFAHCIKLIGYDTLINTSGDYTVFAPDNDAFTQYFQSHPAYKTENDIPITELTRIVKYHIIKDPWSVEQLKKIDIYGWIDTTDENNNQPKGFKKETILRDKDIKYGVTRDNLGNYLIVDTLLSPWYRRHATDGSKFASIFYKQYLDIYGLISDDYQFYFNRPFENPNDMYYLGGKIIKGNIFAENGFVHIIDRVVEPLQNAYEILDTKKDKNSYSKFLNLVNTFTSFSYNKDRTNAQSGGRTGQVVDSLFDITYPSLTFDIINEQTKAPYGITLPGAGNVTIRYQNGLIAPTNEALDAFVNEYLVGAGKWGSLSNIPPFIRQIIVKTYMSNNPIYPTNFQQGFMNGEQDKVTLDKSTIIQQQFGSNCTFIGVNKAIAPRAFKSVAGPAFLNTGYFYSYLTIFASGLLPALKKENKDYSFFIESDLNCRNDSSLIYRDFGIRNGQQIYQPVTFQRTLVSSVPSISLTIADLRTLLLNHIGVETPKGIGRKEFIKTLGGNYLIVNNQTKEVSGTAPTTVGYNGSATTQVIPTQISINADNGKTYDISNWFNFSAPSIYTKISSSDSLSQFQTLLRNAGLTDDNAGKYTFLSDNEFYTAFIPTNSALKYYRTDTLTKDQMKKFLMMHFVQGDMIFTDGKKPSNYYETLRVDEKSTFYSTVFTKVYISTGVDVINFLDQTGNNYMTINEAGTTNIITGYSPTVSGTPPAFPVRISNAVIHQINKVLLFKNLDTK